MFTLMKERIVIWPVTVQMPIDGGKFEELTFNAKLRLVSEDPKVPVADVVTTALIGWDGVNNEDGAAIPFDEANRELLLAVPYVRTAVSRAYYEAALGAAKRKN